MSEMKNTIYYILHCMCIFISEFCNSQFNNKIIYIL